MDDAWMKARRAANERLQQIARAAAQLRQTHGIRVIARRWEVGEATPSPVVRLGVRFRDDGR